MLAIAAAMGVAIAVAVTVQHYCKENTSHQHKTSNSASRIESHCIHAIETKNYILLINITKNLPTTFVQLWISNTEFENRVEFAAVANVPCFLRKATFPSAFPM